MLFYFGYVTFFGILFFACWNRYRDPFHPWIIFIPQFIFLYGVFPLPTLLSDQERFINFSGGDFLYWYQFLTVILPLCLLIGVWRGARRPHLMSNEQRLPSIAKPRSVQKVVIILGSLAVLSWLYGIFNVGGFYAAYGQGDGGGWDDSGYVREMPFIGILGALLVFLLRVGKGMRPLDWVLILFCISPVLLHGLLGARRGPTFMSAIIVAGGYIYFMQKRVSLSIVLPASVMVGMFMLFLVVNRADIHLGSEVAEYRSPLEFFEQWNASEYLIGSAVARYAETYGSFYGAREAAHLIGRMTPKPLWPNVYSDISQAFGYDIDFTLNAGINPVAIEAVTGWQPSVGSAMGFVGDFWIEFYYFGLGIAYLIGYFYGWVWRKSTGSITAKLGYLIMIALSIYLVMQDLDAWLFRLLLLGIPLLSVMRLVKVRHSSLTPRFKPARLVKT